EVAAEVRQGSSGRRPREPASLAPPRLTTDELTREHPVLTELEPRVERINSVPGSSRIAVRNEHTNAGLVSELPFHTQDADRSGAQRIECICGFGAGIRRDQLRVAVVCGQNADCPRPNFARQPDAHAGVNDASREEEANWGLEEARMFQEERTSF